MDIESISWERLSSSLASCFDKDELNKLSRESRLVQRSSSKFDGESFLFMNVFNTSTGKERSLNDCCDWLEDHYGISLSKQSLDERYNTYAVAFMKSCFLRVLAHMNEQALNGVSTSVFSCIQLTDSTSFKIPDELAHFYKGCQGDGGQAQVKLHLNYDLLKGSIVDIAIGDGAMNDNSYKFGPDEKIKKNGLYLRDLGYYNFEYLRTIFEGGGYVLSRSKSNITYYIKDEQGQYQKLDILEYMAQGGKPEQLPEVYLGAYKKKLKVRLILEEVPEEVAQKRIEKTVKTAAKKKKQVSVQRKALCYYNIFITNIPSTHLSAEDAWKVYSLRWQIELMFKTWKSYYDINKIGKMNIFRFECYLYAKLIAILINLNIQNNMQEVFMHEFDFELSTIKAAKIIKKSSAS